MEKLTYKQYREQKQKSVNDLPIFFAFSDRQLAEEMQKRGLAPDAFDKISRLGKTGGFYLRSDSEKIKAWFNAPDPLPELMEDPAFAEEAFYYELGNHEYHLNTYQGDYDVCSCFGNCEWGGEGKSYRKYLSEMGYSESVIASFKKARDKFLQDADENGWY